MTEANDIQIGGNHYQKLYQHWDFVIDLKIHYLIGCATKYVSRWRDKNGIQDLQKAIHYLTKAEEHDIYTDMRGPFVFRWLNSEQERSKMLCLSNFCDQHDPLEADIILNIIFSDGDYSNPIKSIEALIMGIENCEFGNNYFKG